MIRRILLLFVLVFALSGADKPPISDDSLYDQVRRRLASDPDVKGGALDVEVKEGVVTLRGSVDGERQKKKAASLAKKVKGVKSVNNELAVKEKGR